MVMAMGAIMHHYKQSVYYMLYHVVYASLTIFGLGKLFSTCYSVFLYIIPILVARLDVTFLEQIIEIWKQPIRSLFSLLTRDTRNKIPNAPLC